MNDKNLIPIETLGENWPPPSVVLKYIVLEGENIQLGETLKAIDAAVQTYMARWSNNRGGKRLWGSQMSGGDIGDWNASADKYWENAAKLKAFWKLLDPTYKDPIKDRSESYYVNEEGEIIAVLDGVEEDEEK